MYTVYIIISVIIVLSFITGNILLITEHKFKNKKMIIDNGKIIDEEIL